MTRCVSSLSACLIVLMLVDIVCATNPAPQISANGLHVPLTLTPSDSLSVTVTLDPGGDAGTNADWWVAAYSPVGWYYYDVFDHSQSWKPGLSPTYTGALFALPSFTVLDVAGLPPGVYTFYFGVDTNMNGVLDLPLLYLDSVIVSVSSSCDFSSDPGDPARCFGGIGTGCRGDAPGAPFIQEENTCSVYGWMSAGSILHDTCCLTHPNGYMCGGNNTDPSCRTPEWDEAVANTVCMVFGAPRQWAAWFGPYPAGNTGDDTNLELRAPVGARVNPVYQHLCSSGECERDTQGSTILYQDQCGQYCECSG